MGDMAKEILLNIYNCYNEGENYTIKTPPSSQIHNFNMAIKEIDSYIEFIERGMMKISMTLSDEGIEYCLENFI